MNARCGTGGGGGGGGGLCGAVVMETGDQFFREDKVSSVQVVSPSPAAASSESSSCFRSLREIEEAINLSSNMTASLLSQRVS